MRGIVRHEGRLIILMDLDRILSSEERIALGEAMTPAAGAADAGA